MKKESFVFAGLLFLVLVVSRLVPHPAQLTAILAVALFSGSLWAKNNYLRFGIPLLAVFVTDLYFGIYPGLVFNYAALILCAVIAPKVLGSVWSIAARGLAAAVIFFILSNFGVWAQAGLYTLDGEGLIKCYTMAIPFFTNTLIGTWFYSLVFYSSYRLAFLKRDSKDF